MFASDMLEDVQSIKKAIGTRVRSLREDAGWTQADLAYEADLDTSTISKLELGKGNVKLESIIAIAGVFKMKIWELVKYDNVSPNDL